MKLFMVTGMLIIISIFAFLYLSGNTPYVSPRSERLILEVNMTSLSVAKATYQTSCDLLGMLRCNGFPIPLTYNERLQEIGQIKAETVLLCDEILRHIETSTGYVPARVTLHRDPIRKFYANISQIRR